MSEPTTNAEQTTANDVEAAYAVWIVDVEAERAYRYADWLDDEYAVHVEPDGVDPVDAVSSDPDVALLDRRPVELSGDEFLEQVRDGELSCRVVVVTPTEPAVDLLDLGVDSFLTRPVSRERLRGTISRLTTLTSYTETVGEYYAVAARKAALETASDRVDRDACEEYRELQCQLRRLSEAADASMAVVAGTREFTAVFRELA